MNTKSTYIQFNNCTKNAGFERPENRAEVDFPHLSQYLLASGEAFLWSGKADLPAIGERVLVGMNQWGKGMAVGYFAEDGWLGVLVKPDAAPKWWRELKANKGKPVGLVHVFGAELV